MQVADASEGRVPTRTVSADEASPTTLAERVRSLRLPPEVTADRSRRRWWIGLGLILLAVGTVGGWLAMRQAASKAVDTSEKASSAGAATASADGAKRDAGAKSTSAPVADSGAIANQAKGYIVPARQILISPQVSGRIVELRIQEGQRVNEGDVLARIEDTEYRADRDRAKAMVEVAKWTLAEMENGSREEEKRQAYADWKEAEIQRDYWRTLVDRYQKLLQSRTIPQEQFDDAVTRFTAAEQRARRLENAWYLVRDGAREERRRMAAADLARAEAELEKAEWRLANCVIRAPVTGTILRKNAEKGNLVNPIAMQGSYSLCEMADLSDLEVDVAIQERDIAEVFLNQRCKIKTESWPDRTDEGYVSRLMPIADRAKGVVSVRVKITSIKQDEEGVYLKPEMTALVTFLKKARPPQARGSGQASSPGDARGAQQ